MLHEPTLFLLCGLPFAGKTTFATRLAGLRGWHYIALDPINGEFGFGANGAAILPHQWEQTYAEAYRRVTEALDSGRAVIYDETNFLRVQRDQLRAIAADRGITTYLLYVTTPPEEARRRWLANRQRPQRGDVRDEDFAQVLNRFEPPGDDEQVLVYSTDETVEAWVERYLNH